ncbi:DUF977 family protein [Salmonella enterica]
MARPKTHSERMIILERITGLTSMRRCWALTKIPSWRCAVASGVFPGSTAQWRRLSVSMLMRRPEAPTGS